MISYFSPVPAREGFEWMKLSLQIFRAHWQRYVALASMFLLILQMSSLLTGGLLFMFVKPILSVGFLAAAWHHERGEIPEIRHLFAGFKSNLRALIPLGAVYLVGVLVAAAIGLTTSGLTMEQLKNAQEAAALPPDAVMQFMLVTIVLTLPITAALWFSPALIVFSDASFVQSLVVSARACLQNWLSMTVYAFSMFSFLLLATLVMSPILFILSPSIKIVVVLMMVVPMTAIQMISDYVSYRRIFHRDERVEKIAVAK
jgi:hypothetical protein